MAEITTDQTTSQHTTLARRTLSINPIRLYFFITAQIAEVSHLGNQGSNNEIQPQHAQYPDSPHL